MSGSGAQADAPAKFEGQMIVSGNSMQWRMAPIDNVNAALLFHDRELEIISAQMLRADDFLRGSGRISLGDGSYSGEWRLSARDLAAYKAVLTPYVLPAPLGGGIEATWAGKGSGVAHEGKFSAKLSRFHLLGPGGTLPLDAEFSGVYRPGEVQCEKFRLAEDGTVLTAGISVGPSAVNLRDILVQQHGRTSLQGDALLPLDLWQRWPDVNFAHLLNDQTIGRVRIEVTNLDLLATSRLTGVQWPLAGNVSGTVTADGPLGALKLGGAIQLLQGSLPLDWQGHAVRDVGARFVLEGNQVRLEQAAGHHANGNFTIAGKLDLVNPRSPVLEVTGSGTNQSKPFSFTAKGPAEKPVITVVEAPPPPPPPAPPAPPIGAGK